jgi:hypothetical protein
LWVVLLVVAFALATAKSIVSARATAVIVRIELLLYG